MDENTGIRKKPRAISARPAVRPASGTLAPASQAAPLAPGAQAPLAESMQVIEGGGVKPGPNVKSYIERQLKSVYGDVLNQPIPDRFLDLLNALYAAPGVAQDASARSGKSEKKEGRE